jgi:phosphoglycerate dehydrogenase-like enzyme
MDDTMTRVAILDDYQNVALEMADWQSLGFGVRVQAFHDHLTDHDALVERLSDFEVISVMRERTPFPAPLIERLRNLKLLVTTGWRNASIDVKFAAERGIMVCGTEVVPSSTVELTWGLILAAARHIVREDDGMRSGRWQTTVGTGLEGRTLSLFGLGNLGSRVALIGKAFGMQVIAWSPNLTEERARSFGAERVEKNELFRRADFLSIHVVLSSRSRGTVGADELAAMKPTAYLINTSRGPIVNEHALIAALASRKIAGAALDVYDQEPLPPDHPLRRLDNVVLTPHLGYVTVENYRRMYAQVIEDIRAFLEGHPVRIVSAAR